MTARLAAAASVFGLVLAGCGGGDADTSSSLVAPDRRPPINALSVEPGDESLLMSTNRGLYRIQNGQADRVPASISTSEGTSRVGRFLSFTFAGDALLGSGHPDQKRRLAPFLGLIRSDDRGRSWRLVSRYSFSDLHAIDTAGRRIYAYDAVLGGFLSSPDAGRTWTENLGLLEPFIDLVVDPGDPDHILASSAKQIYDSTDGGRSWSVSSAAEAARLAWPEPGALFRADQDGLLYEGGSDGARWDLVGRVDGEPWELEAADGGDLFVALSDATVLESTDRGRNWEEVFSP